MITKGFDVNAQDDDKWSALHYATQNYYTEIVKLLIKNNADVNIKDSNGNTPLSNAVFHCPDGSGDLIYLLRKAGADPFLENNYGVNSYDLAQQIANYDIKQYFKDIKKSK